VLPARLLELVETTAEEFVSGLGSLSLGLLHEAVVLGIDPSAVCLFRLLMVLAFEAEVGEQTHLFLAVELVEPPSVAVSEAEGEAEGGSV